LLVILIIARAGLIISIAGLMRSFVRLVFADFQMAFGLLDMNIADYFFGFIAIPACIPILILIRKKKFMSKRLTFLSGGMTLIVFTLIFAPLIVYNNPDFQKEPALTKLLPPFGRVAQVYLPGNFYKTGDPADDFINLRNSVIKNTFDENLLFADSVKKDNKAVYLYKTGDVKKLVLNSGAAAQPEISTRFFILGSDELGRDVFTRLVYGMRVSILIGVCSVFISFVLGIAFGFIAGYAGGITDMAISRFTEMFLAFPLIFFVVLIISLFGNSVFTVIFVLGFSGWMSLLKIVKGEVIALKSKDYFLTARQLGLTKKQLLLKEILPVIYAPVMVNLIFQFGNVILAESALSFLGFGPGNKYPSWGGMIHSGQNYITNGWWLILFPGCVIIGVLLLADRFGNELNRYFNTGLDNDK
jgi:peptide/nickel transport system permease protein